MRAAKTSDCGSVVYYIIKLRNPAASIASYVNVSGKYSGPTDTKMLTGAFPAIRNKLITKNHKLFFLLFCLPAYLSGSISANDA
jgi:hypothetical protein